MWFDWLISFIIIIIKLKQHFNFEFIDEINRTGWKVYDEQCQSNAQCASLNCVNGKCAGGSSELYHWCDDNRVCKSLICDYSNRKCLLGTFKRGDLCYSNEACFYKRCDLNTNLCDGKSVDNIEFEIPDDEI